MAVFRVTSDGVQAAITAASPYDTIILPAGVINCPDANGFIIDKPLTIQGAGKPYQFENLTGAVADQFVGWTNGTVVRVYQSAATSDGGKNSTGFRVVGPVTNVVIRDLGIECPYYPPTVRPVTPGTGIGIFFDATADYLGYCRIENVAIRFMGLDGVSMTGSTDFGVSTQVIDFCEMVHVDIVGCRRHSFRQYRNYDVTADQCTFIGSEQCGIYSESSFNLRFLHPLFNNNGQSFVNSGTNWKGGGASWPCYDQAQMYLNGVNGFTIERPDFEQWTGSGHDTGATWTAAQVPHALALYGSNAGKINGVRTYTPGYGDPGGVDSVLLFLGDNCRDINLGDDNQSGDVTHSLFAMDDRGIRGIRWDLFNVIDHGWGAPCNITIKNQADTEGAGNPTGGNFGVMSLTGTDDLNRVSFKAGLVFPRVSSEAAITTTPTEATLFYDAKERLFKFHDGAAWQPVAARMVFYNDELVTVDDEAVTY